VISWEVYSFCHLKLLECLNHSMWSVLPVNYLEDNKYSDFNSQIGEKIKEKEKEKHNSTGSISSKSSLSSNSTVGSIGTPNNNSSSGTFTINTNNSNTSTDNKCDPTWVHDMFEGTLTNETRCLCCETVSGIDHLNYNISNGKQKNGLKKVKCLKKLKSPWNLNLTS
jgi:hypothetical protein